jgi:hypothetical protein
MNGQRQKIQNEQLALAFMTEGEGEARRTVHEGFEPFVASHDWTWAHQCVHIWEALPPHLSYGF